MVHIIGSNHMLVIFLSSNVIIITFGLKKIEIDPCTIHLFSICAICKFLKLENWIYWAKRRGSFGNDFSEKLFWWEEYSNFESCDFDGRILVMTFGKPICGSSRREKEKKPLLPPPHKHWLKKVPLLCLKGYKSMKWDFRRAVIDACNYFHACPNSTGCLDIAYTTHAPTTAGATEILQISS